MSARASRANDRCVGAPAARAAAASQPPRRQPPPPASKSLKRTPRKRTRFISPKTWCATCASARPRSWSGLEPVRSTALGEVAADQARYAEVAPPTPGRSFACSSRPMASVGRGTPLAQLRSTDLGRARADLLSAEARRDLARQTLDRKRTLAAERIVALREVQEAEAAFRAADAEVRAATAVDAGARRL